MRRAILPLLILAAIASAAFYAGAESVTSDSLRTEREPATAKPTNHHSANSNCARCHKAHLLGKEHSAVSCAACHIGVDSLRDAATACTDCHEEGIDAAPKLSIFRAASYKYRLHKPDEMIQPSCSDCHDEPLYNRAFSPLAHPVRSVGSHIACVKCHDIGKDGALAKDMSGYDYPMELCGECHEDVQRAFLLNEPHSLVRRNVRCRQCHPPHGQFQANLTVENMAMMGNQSLAGYDPIASNELCLRCHNYLTLTGPDTRFALPGGISLHQLHMEMYYASCVECHNPHDATSRGMVRDMTLDGEPLLHFALESGGSCSVKCHGHAHSSAAYLPQY